MKPVNEKISTGINGVFIAAFLLLLFAFSNRSLLKATGGAPQQAAAKQLKPPPAALIKNPVALAQKIGNLFPCVLNVHRFTKVQYTICASLLFNKVNQPDAGERICSRFYYHLFSIQGEPPAAA